MGGDSTKRSAARAYVPAAILFALGLAGLGAQAVLAQAVAVGQWRIWDLMPHKMAM
jgi:hypothetical protein